MPTVQAVAPRWPDEPVAELTDAADAELAMTGPVHRVLMANGAPVWLVTDHEQVRALLTDPRPTKPPPRPRGQGGAGLPPDRDAVMNSDLPAELTPDAGTALSLALRELAELVERATGNPTQHRNNAQRAGTEPEAAAAIVLRLPCRTGNSAVLRRSGGVWVVNYRGRTAHAPDRKGMRDLARLLAIPGQEVHSLDLLGASGPAGERPSGVALRPPGSLGEVLDAPARAAYRARIEALRAELDAADERGDAAVSARADAELTFLTRELSAAVGLGGRPRHAGDLAERARSTVTWRIRYAIATIAAAHTDLGKHLGRFVRTGRYCAYEPGDAVDWQVQS